MSQEEGNRTVTIKHSWFLELASDIEHVPSEVKERYPELFGKLSDSQITHLRLEKVHSLVNALLARLRLQRLREINADHDDVNKIKQACQESERRASQSMTDSLDMARKSFACEYQNKEELLGVYMEFVSRLIYKWAEDSKTNPIFHSMYHSVVNGSGLGKSRLVSEVGKNMCLVVYMNLAETTDVVPQPTSGMLAWFMLHGATSLGRRAELNIQSLILAIGEVMLDWLTNEGPKYNSDHPKLFAAWSDYQRAAGFWPRMQTMQIEFAQKMDSAAKVYALAFEIQGRRQDAEALAAAKTAQMQLQEGLWIEAVPAGIPEDLWNKTNSTDPLWYAGLAAAFKEKLDRNTRQIHDLLWSTHGLFPDGSAFNSNIRCPYLEQWKEAYWPTWLFVLDESQSLLVPGSPEVEDTKSQETVFHNVRRVFRLFPRYKISIAGLVMDTTSKISNFSTPNALPPSSRLSQILPFYGKSLFPPFFDIRSIDVHPFGTEKLPLVEPQLLKDVLYSMGYSRYGRAALFAWRNSSLVPDRFFDFLRRKMLGTNSAKPVRDAAYVAILSFMVCISVVAYSPLAEELLGSFMQKCAGISEDRHAPFIRSIPEPSMGMAARQQLISIKWLEILNALNKRGFTDIDAGIHGEVALQIILIMAINAAEEQQRAKFATWLEPDYPILPVTIKSVLGRLGFYNDQKKYRRDILDQWEAFLSCSYIRAVQFTKSFSESVPDFLLGRFCRANGIVCRRNFTGVDGILPLYVSERPLEDRESILNAKIDKSRMSIVGLQFKNQTFDQGPTDAMEIQRVLGPACLARNRKLSYVSLLLDTGSTVDGKPRFFAFESADAKQLSVAVRGVRPSQVLGTVGDDAAQLDAAFERFVEGPNGPSVRSTKHAEGDLFAYSAASVAAEHGGELVRDAKQTVAAARKFLGSSAGASHKNRDKIVSVSAKCDSYLRLITKSKPVPSPEKIQPLSLVVQELFALLEETSELSVKRLSFL